MSAADVLQIAGTVAFFLFALICAYLALNAERFSVYGKEALLAAAALMFTAGLMRMLVIWDRVTREEAMVVNSAAAIAFVLVGIQLVVMRLALVRYQRERQPKEEP